MATENKKKIFKIDSDLDIDLNNINYLKTKDGHTPTGMNNAEENNNNNEENNIKIVVKKKNKIKNKIKIDFENNNNQEAMPKRLKKNFRTLWN
jgi:hypothetical protein